MRAVWTFIAASFCINALCAAVLLFARRGPRPRRTLTVLAAAIVTIELLVTVYGYLIEPRRLDVQSVAIAIPGVSTSSCLTLVHFSDLHSPSNAAIESDFLARVREIAPDAIVFSGDVANSPAGVVRARAFFASLVRIAPTYAIRGNRDFDLPTDFFQRAGTQELRAAVHRIESSAFQIAIVGASRQEDRRSLARAMRIESRSNLLVYVGHSPDEATDALRWGADLVLAGHTHGGQIAFPIIGPLWTGARVGGRSGAGRFHLPGGLLYITRGLGMEALFPKVRIGARPELTVINIFPRSDVRTPRFFAGDQRQCRWHR